MAGLEVTGVHAGQSTTGATGGQPKQMQNIVIEFRSLPDKLKTKKVREFYDKDFSGFLESNNANGQNEIALMQQAFRTDLSKYKSSITYTNSFHTSAYNTYEGYDKNGNKVVEINDFGSLIQELRFNKGRNIVETKNDNGETTHSSQFTNYDANYNPVNSQEAVSGNNVVSKFFFKDGYLMFDRVGNKDGYYKTNGNKVYDGICPKIVKTNDLTKGKNNLKQNIVYEVNPQMSDRNNITISDAIEQGEKKEIENYTTLNGKRVQAKSIGKGRYEVTDDKGNIFYISHDGVKLKPEHVRNNP